MNLSELYSQKELQNQVISLLREVKNRDNQINALTEQLEWLKRQVFGQRSERMVSNSNSRQLLLNGLAATLIPAEVKKPVAAHERKKPNRDGRDKLTYPDDLPIETVILDLPEKDKTCQETGLPLVHIGNEVTHKLAHKPGSFFVKEIIRPKYANPQKEEEGIKTAELPTALFDRCKVDESLLAEIITRKFGDHLPLYRLSEIFKREYINISHKLLSQWIIRSGMALKPLYYEMLKQALASKNIYIDESPVKIQEVKKCKLGYMWVVVGGNEADPPYRIYNFRDNRRHENVLDILKDYRGGLHSDKYGAYENLAKAKLITWFPCWSHIRRKFFEAEAGDPIFRKLILRKIRYIFMFEAIAWKKSPEERLRIRKEKEEPILDELIKLVTAKLNNGKILPKSKFREALGYFYSLIPYMKNYLTSPFARIDNNVAERAVRPLAIGRKNWLFFGSPEGAEAGAIHLSLVQTCRGLGINPREYMEDVMRRIMDHDTQKLYELLPDNWRKVKQA